MSDFPRTVYQTAIFAGRPLAESGISRCEYLPQTNFYAKDTGSRFVSVHRQFLENHGLDEKTQALGKTHCGFHPAVMAEVYMCEDQRDGMLHGVTSRFEALAE